MSDFLAELQHSWGKSAKQKAREKEYDAEYYRKNKDKWAAKLDNMVQPGSSADNMKQTAIDRLNAEYKLEVAKTDAEKQKVKQELVKARSRQAAADKAKTEKYKDYQYAQKQYDKWLNLEMRERLQYKVNANKVKKVAQKGASFVDNLVKK